MAGASSQRLHFFCVFSAFALIRLSCTMPVEPKVEKNPTQLKNMGSKVPNQLDRPTSGTEKGTYIISGSDKTERPIHISEIYRQFYAEKTPGSFAINDGLVHRMFDEKVSDELAKAQKERRELREQILQSFLNGENLHPLVWEALSGLDVVPVTVPVELASKDKLVLAMLAQMRTHLYDGNVLEIGSGLTLLRLAEQYTNFTSMAVTLDETKGTFLQDISKRRGIQNLFVGHVSVERLPAIAEELYNDHQVLFSNILLTEVDQLVGTLLPHELEELLARLFALTPQVFIANINTTAPLLSYFQGNWPNVMSLLDRSCQVASLTCKIQRLGWYDRWDGSDAVTVYKVVVTKGVRTLPSALCGAVRPDTQCVLQFNNKSESVDIVFSDDSRAQAPTSPDTLPLHIMLKLGLLPTSAEQILLKSLKLIYRQDVTGRSIQAFGNHVIVFAPMENGIPLDIFNNSNAVHEAVANLLTNKIDKEHNQQGEELTEKKPQLGLEHSDTKVYFQTEIPIKFESISKGKGNSGVEILKQTTPSELKAKESLVQSQVDGVAQRWKRVDGDIPNSQKKDQEQMKVMGKQWDRENVEGVPGGNPLKAKAQEQLKNLDKVINREAQEGDEDHVDIEAEVDHKDQAPALSEATLSKDEKDFQKALGFLHGNSDMKEVGKLTKAINFMKHSSRGIVEQIKPPRPDKSVDNLIDQIDLDDPENGRDHDQIEKPDIDEEDEVEHLLDSNELAEIQKEADEPVVKQGDVDDSEIKEEDGQIVPPLGQGEIEIGDRQDVQDYDYEEEEQEDDREKPDEEEDKGEDDEEENEDAEEDQDKLAHGDQPKNVDEDDKRNQPAKGGMRRLLAEELPDIAGEVMGSRTGGKNQGQTEAAAKVAEITASVSVDGSKKVEIENNEEDLEEDDISVVKFGPIDMEESLYDIQWPLIRDQIQKEIYPQSFFSILTYGDTHQSLIGLKLARTYPHANVLSVMPPCRHSDYLRHSLMVTNLVVQNNLVLEADLTASVIQAINRLPELFRYQILGVDVFASMVGLQEGFLLYLGHTLSLARTTFLEVPDPRQLLLLQGLLKLLAPGSKDNFADGQMFMDMIHQALRLVNVDQYSVQLMEYHSQASAENVPLKILQVTIHSLNRQVMPGCTGHTTSLTLSPDGTVTLSDGRGQHLPLIRAQEAFSLQTLLLLNLYDQNKERKRLFWQYLDLPVMEDMCPVHILWFNNTLVYNTVDQRVPVLQTHKEDWRIVGSQALSRLLVSDLDVEPFSFMQYGAPPGDIILNLAEKYRNSTFIALVDNSRKSAHALYDHVKKLKLANIVVNNLKIDKDFTGKLLESPEFFRYQFINERKLLQLGSTLVKPDFNTLLGQMIASSITTFLQVPSSQMQSLAMTTFFPNLFHGRPLEEIDPAKMFHPSEHPLPLYKNAEFKFIGERAQANVHINISGEVLHPSSLTDGAQLPWKLLRVDVKNLTALVQHHFDYSLDGHDRTYTQHCVSYNKTHFEVWLTRTSDGYKIPFGRVHAITLIALLRMGLLSEIKEDFYNKFIKLPYYEDMAPWNIVFNGGRLEYIDYDTKDRTFNKMVAAAYQVIFMLINYERTVKDFGKCPKHARIRFGIDDVGKCVGSDFTGPCDDSRYPVPCGDHTCRTTYIECLQALNELEKKKSMQKKEVTAKLLEGHMPISSDKSPYEDGNWSFGANGINRAAKS